MVVEGEEVQASMTTTGPRPARIEAHLTDGRPVLAGTASVGPDHPETELEARLNRLGDPGELFIVDQLHVGMRQRQERPVSITHAERNGALYPFSLAEKLECITERHDWYTPEGADSSSLGASRRADRDDQRARARGRARPSGPPSVTRIVP